jgi:hypothetical protein
MVSSSKLSSITAMATSAAAPTTTAAAAGLVLVLSAYYSAMNAHSVAQALVFRYSCTPPCVCVCMRESSEVIILRGIL